jgi:hypothetical protein
VNALTTPEIERANASLAVPLLGIDVTTLRLAMHANGWRPVPVLRHDAPDKAAGKRPTLFQWETVCATADETEIRRWATDYKQRECTNTGLLCGAVVGLDLDLPDVALAEQVGRLADAMLPATPLLRIGRAPKSMRVYRAEGTHHKVATPRLILPVSRGSQSEGDPRAI